MMDYGICGAGPGAPSPVPAALAALLAPAGQALLAELRDCEVGPDSALELGTRLRQRYPAELVASALAQQDLRWRARAKFSRAMDLYFTRDGLEQASSEPVASHRAARLVAAAAAAVGAPPTPSAPSAQPAPSAPPTTSAPLATSTSPAPVVADLCCGVGGDLIALAAAAEATETGLV